MNLFPNTMVAFATILITDVTQIMICMIEYDVCMA